MRFTVRRPGERGWRGFSLPSASSLADVAKTILSLYADEADQDFHPHLYGFWLSGKPWQKDALVYWDPEAARPDPLNPFEAPRLRADRVTLAQLKLGVGQKFLFLSAFRWAWTSPFGALFDLGTEWHFHIRVASGEPLSRSGAT